MAVTERRSAADWQAIYAERLVSAEEAVAKVKSGDLIWVSPGQYPHLLLTALLGRVDELEGVQVKALPIADFGWFSDVFRGRIDINVYMATPFSRDAVNAGDADFTPWWCYGAHKHTDENRPDAHPIDVTFISVSPPNAGGYCCFGAALWDARTAAARAQTVIAEVSGNVPRTFGETWIHVSEIDWFIEHTSPPPERSWLYPAPDPWDGPIAGYVNSVIQDGDAIQVGTGSTTFNMVKLGAFDGKRDLGFFSEMTAPGIVGLVREGVFNSRFLNTHPCKIVTTTAGQTEEDLAFINNNPMFEFYPIEYIHDPRVISRNDNMLAINNALTVDLTGQVGAMSVGPRIWSGTGGHLAFAIGAFLSRGGRYICVVPSTAKSGSASRIVPQFPPGQVVNVPRDVADMVISEYGVARLLNKTLRQRAAELISIAHPDFRGELRKEANRQFSAEF